MAEVTVGVRKTAAHGFGMVISEGGQVSAFSEPASASPAKHSAVPIGREIIAVNAKPVCGRGAIVAALGGASEGDVRRPPARRHAPTAPRISSSFRWPL